ncbi:MAG: hypothetical protein K0S76_1836 [Herbinix sp.]|jgi:serine/threonine-protein kinase|nr:hypothetical protein [Herbinix sp.]
MLKPGMFINDRYEIIDNVGSGGMADVYKAKDQRLNRFVAIKVLKPEYSSDKSFVNKFRGEAQSAAGLSHPNIVNVYDVGDDSGLHYIVMELVEGITLKRFIERKGKLEVKEAVGIAIQIAQGMEAAHDNRIIHRDIKPQNIIISRDGKVKVTDFGIAKATNSNTLTSNTMGSVHYLSPEQARGGYSDEKSDIYSLGVTIYEMLSGKVPFAGDNTVSVALLHIQGEAMPLRDLDPAIPVSVDKIVQKCMQKRPERRYHTALELINDLKKALTNPDGAYVQIPAFVANDSPTINISDDLGKIKNVAYLDEDIPNNPSNKVAEEEEEELDSVDSKMDKFVAIGSVVTIVVLLAAIILIVIWFINNNNNPKDDPNDNKPTDTVTVSPEPTEEPTPTEGTTLDTYIVPGVIGFTEADAEKAIKAKDPDADIFIYQDYSDEYEKGHVMKQYPDPDSEREKTSEVFLTISTGPKSFDLPNVYGMERDKADIKLDDYGLKVIHDFAPSDTVESGLVIETNPIRNSLVKKGDEIHVIISTGPAVKQVPVPDLLGATEANARQMLKDVGLDLGEISYEASSEYAEGLITYQSSTASELADLGSLIDVIISSGPPSNTNEETEDTETGGSGIIKYLGSVTIDDINPFDYIDDSEAEIEIEMEQDSWHYIIMTKRVLTAADFPRTIEDIEGEGTVDGIVQMKINGEDFVLPGETEPYTWIAKFEAVEE